jgi:AcrR family transcriptional regulator
VDARPTLRQRKKARTRQAIQQQAMRLFTARGYEATTIDEICEAAEVGRTTLFRYFPTKEDLVITDDYNARIIAALRAQPADRGPVRALRHAMTAVFADAAPAELEAMHAQVALIGSVPSLRAALLARLAQLTETMEEVLAERSGRDRHDPAVRVYAGAVLGVLMSVFFHHDEVGEAGLPAAVDAALAHLEEGLPL